jgi:hypothetical protein
MIPGHRLDHAFPRRRLCHPRRVLAQQFAQRFRTAALTACPKTRKWIWRWTNPVVDYYPGELTVSDGGQNSTRVEVFY